jgi:hypothetical protein
MLPRIRDNRNNVMKPNLLRPLLPCLALVSFAAAQAQSVLLTGEEIKSLIAGKHVYCQRRCASSCRFFTRATARWLATYPAFRWPACSRRRKPDAGGSRARGSARNGRPGTRAGSSASQSAKPATPRSPGRGMTIIPARRGLRIEILVGPEGLEPPTKRL